MQHTQAACLTLFHTKHTPPPTAHKACLSCGADALSAGGVCLPGAYVLQYSVAARGAGGGTATATRRVVVFQSGRIVSSFDLYPSMDAAAAAALVAALRDPASAAYAAAREAVARRLSAAGPRAPAVRAADVAIDAAAAVPGQGAAAGSASVSVNATVHVYFPPEVTRQQADAASGGGGRRRRLMLLEGGGGGGSGGNASVAGAALPELHEEGDNEEAAAEGLPEPAARARALLARHKRFAAALSAEARRRRADRAHAAAAEDCGHEPHGAGCSVGRYYQSGGGSSDSRRALLQTGSSSGSDGLSGTMASMSGALQSAYGAQSSQQSDTQAVDVVGGYLAALSANAALLEERAAALGAGVASAQAKVEQTFGAEAAQREGARSAQVEALYDALLSDWGALVASVSALADRAAGGFDEQAAAFAALSGAVSGTVASMREAASYAERLLVEYVGQQAMLDAATGAAGRVAACARPGTFVARFNVTLPPAPAGAANATANATASGNATAADAAAARRRLLADAANSTAGDGSSSGAAADDSGWAVINDELFEWEGYRVNARAASQRLGADLGDAPERARHIGASEANRIIGGLFLHATRRPAGAPPARCSADAGGGGGGGNGSRSSGGIDATAAALDFGCTRAAQGVPLARDDGAVALAEYRAWLRGRGAAAAPYGVDPAFLRQSGLYRPDLAGREALYYNVSDPDEVSPATGSPYGFRHRPLAGYAPGFPVLVANRLGAARAADAVQYLLDGNYLDARCAWMWMGVCVRGSLCVCL